jgi:arabinogalactan oligomer/maltooligosaccharide transport system permease protein
VYSTTAIPFCVWMLKGYFDTIPKRARRERHDGRRLAQFSVIFWRIILPLSLPAVAVTALFSFMTAWNEFILAAVFMSEEAALHPAGAACRPWSASSPPSGGTSRRAPSW